MPKNSDLLPLAGYGGQGVRHTELCAARKTFVFRAVQFFRNQKSRRFVSVFGVQPNWALYAR